MEYPGDSHVDGIEKLRLDAVCAVVAELAALERVRRRDVELEEQLAGLRLAGRRRRAVGLVPIVVGHAAILADQW
jgi:hypothetical protein